MPEGGLEPFAQWTRVVAEEAPGFAVISPVGDTSQHAQSFRCVDFREERVEGFHQQRQWFEYLMWDSCGNTLAGDMAGKLKRIQKRAGFPGDNVGFTRNAFFHCQNVTVSGVVHMCPTDSGPGRHCWELAL